jgi:DNA gyrase subunit A
VAYIDNKEVDDDTLISLIKAPDFPTGGIIYGYQGVKDAYLTGRGRIVLRGKAEIEATEDREIIVISEVPYMVNKAEMVKHISDLVKDGRLEGISDIADESNREGIRIVITPKRDTNAGVLLNKLYKETALQSSFSVNNIALVKGRPRLLTLRDIISCFVEHRHEVVVRRTQYDLKKAEDRAHLVEGLIIASDNIDEVVAIIKSSKTVQEAISRLMERFNLSEVQANYVVQMQLRQLTGLMQEKLRAEYEELLRMIEHFKEILANLDLRMQIIKDELLEVKEKYGDERRTQIVYASEEFNPEDFYANE